MFEDGLVNIYSDDLPRALTFYRDLIGFHETFRDDQADPQHVELRLGRLAIAVSTTDAARTFHEVEPEPGSPAVALVLWATDTDEACRRLASAGTPVAIEPRNHGPNRTALVHDPDGNLVEIVSRRGA